MARFKTEVKLFVLGERAEGKGWKVIRERIRERFKIEPPTVRAMQKWEKNLDRVALSAEIMKDIKREMPAMQASAQVHCAQGLLPVLWEARDAGEDLELVGWKFFLRSIEGILGGQRFERVVNEYMSERKKEVS